MTYDSRHDTEMHIGLVRELLAMVVRDLSRRALIHDASKLADPEKAVFDEMTPQLRGVTYGSPEYTAMLAKMKPALDHHYANNPHHPEHWPNGIADMSLLDLIEMLCDWVAASKRHADGDVRKSIELNQKRFGYGDDLKQLLLNTVIELGL